MKIVARSLEELEIGPARTFAGLSVVPLLAREVARGERPYRTLDQALRDGTVRVTEVDAHGSVPELRFVNDGDRPVLLIDGEELVGAKQDRILNLTILAPAKASIIIPVSCVEAGRWASLSRCFSSSKQLMSRVARLKKMSQVSEAYATAGAPLSNQSEIWHDVAALSARHGVQSPTSDMSDVYRSRSHDLDEYVAAFPAVDRQVGALFALAGQIRGVEIFDRDTTLKDLLPKIVRSWALDAIEVRESAHEVPGEKEARAFLDEIRSARLTRHDGVGLGQDVRLEGDRLAGGALVHEDSVVHLCAFRLDQDEGEGSGWRSIRSRMTRASRRGRRNPSA
jgi:hypothetical protein